MQLKLCQCYLIGFEYCQIVMLLLWPHKGTLILKMKRRNNFSIGNRCECMCHTKGNIQDFCGYCATSHRDLRRTPAMGMKH